MILESKNGTTRNITFSLASTAARDLEILLLRLVFATLAKTVTLKTDSDVLYEFTLEMLNVDNKCKPIYIDDDIYSKDLVTEELEIKTYYEKMHLEAEKTIKYVKFTI